eukprot:1789486-Pyramimonas_sp.AAC.1
MPKLFKRREEIIVFGILVFSLPMGSGGPKLAQKRPKKWPKKAEADPKIAQEAPTSAPREPQDAV